jgi:hypothetical protein
VGGDSELDTLNLAEGAIVILLRPEETRPRVICVCRPDHELDMERVVNWVHTQPDLLELLVRALRLAGVAGDVLDSIGEAAGAPGDDEVWLELWRRHEPWKHPVEET